MEEPGGLQSVESDPAEQLNSNKNNWEDSTCSGAAEHVLGSLWAATTAAHEPGALLRHRRSPVVRGPYATAARSPLLTATRESPHTAVKTQSRH